MASVRIDPKWISRSLTAAQRGLWAAGEQWKGDARKTLSGQRSGHEGRVPGTATTYTMSAPGEAPAVRTGNLKSRVASAIEAGGDEAVIYLGSNPPYAPMLEFGTSKMAPRPWARPTLLQSWPLMLKRFAAATGMAVK